jgi:hypothetical protein
MRSAGISVDVSAAVVIALIAVATALALGGWLSRVSGLLLAHRVRTGSTQARAPGPIAAAVVLAALALVGVVGTPEIAVFLAVVALNRIVGPDENVPFSTYPMFSVARSESWSLRFEDSAGRPVSIASLGIFPHTARKRFGSELREAMTSSDSADDVRRRAAQRFGIWLSERRRATGPLAGEPITVVFVAYRFDGRDVVTSSTPLAISEPT